MKMSLRPLHTGANADKEPGLESNTADICQCPGGLVKPGTAGSIARHGKGPGENAGEHAICFIAGNQKV